MSFREEQAYAHTIILTRQQQLKLESHAKINKTTPTQALHHLATNILGPERLVPREVDWDSIGVDLDKPKQDTSENLEVDQGKVLTNAQKWEFIKDGFEVIPCANGSWVIRQGNIASRGVKTEFATIAFSTLSALIIFLDEAINGLAQ